MLFAAEFAAAWGEDGARVSMLNCVLAASSRGAHVVLRTAARARLQDCLFQGGTDDVDLRDGDTVLYSDIPDANIYFSSISTGATAGFATAKGQGFLLGDDPGFASATAGATVASVP